MNGDILLTIGIAIFLAILSIIGWLEILVWNECRKTNSVLYCLKLVIR
jgi:hypothetical protein